MLNLFIVGAPRAGTTSLFDWLGAHPEICGSSLKETYYFMDADNPLLNMGRSDLPQNSPPPDYNLEVYNQFFRHCSSLGNIKLEATPHYLYQQITPTLLAQFQPQPFVVVVIRHPSQRILSHFNFTQNNLLRIVPTVSFQEFTQALLEDQFETLKPKIYDDQAYFWLKNQLRYSRYHEHLQRWQEQFPPEKMRIILFEDMIANPQKIIQDLAQCIGIDERFYHNFVFKASNSTRAIKYKRLRRFLRQSKQSMTKLFPQAKSGINQLKSLFLQSSPPPQTPSPQVETEAMSRLNRYFLPHNQNLAQDFHLNLDLWQS